MPKKLSNNIYYLSCILIALLGIILFRLIKVYDIFCTILGIAIPVIFGYIFAWILNPIYKKMNKKLDRRISIVIIVIVFLLFYTVLIWKLIPIFIKNGLSLIETLSSYTDKLAKYPFLEGLSEYSSLDVNVIIDSCSNFISWIIEFVLIHIFGFYILFTYDYVNSFLRSIIPLKYKRLVLDYIRKMSINMRSYIRGTLLDTVILFIISSILYTLIGLEYPIMLALFSAITNIIPFVGPYIGGIPAVLVGLGKSLNLGLITVGVIVFAQTIESNIINPMIMSKCIKINPILIIISLSVMGKFFGLLGMIFAVPVLIIFKLSLEFYKKYKTSREENS